MDTTIDGVTLREMGVLQEVNRQFFHPLGLAMAIEKSEDGNDWRIAIYSVPEDPDGFVFEDLSSEEDIAKARAVETLRDMRKDTRLKKFGWIVQPIGSVFSEDSNMD